MTNSPMPLLLKPKPSTECHYTEWSVNPAKRAALVETLAYLYLRQEENAERIIAELEPKLRAKKGRVAENAIQKLTAPDADDIELAASGTDSQKADAKNRIINAINQRDGLLFQHVSWIVARQSMPKSYITSPHVRQADKGFDGFIIELDGAGTQIEKVVLCEDKASEKPRRLVKSKVWPEIKSIQQGDRDDEIMAELSTLLKSVPGIDSEQAVDDMFWEESREYRVAVATGENRRKAGEFLHVIKGFEAATGIKCKSRTAGVMPFTELRSGLAQLALEVTRKIEEIASV